MVGNQGENSNTAYKRTSAIYYYHHYLVQFLSAFIIQQQHVETILLGIESYCVNLL